MKAGAVIQARMGSTRLPGKALADLGGRPILGRVVDRARLANSLAMVGVATTTDERDDPIAAFCAHEGVPCHRGPVDDVLRRYVEAAARWSIDPVVRITGDCPFLCPDAIDALVPALVRARAEYAGYSGPRIGEGVDPFSRSALTRFDGMSLPDDEREHLALIVRRHIDTIKCAWIAPEPGLEPPGPIRLSVDEVADLEFARALHAVLPREYRSADLVAILRGRSDLRAINGHVLRAVPTGVRG
jgi:spore coat polysaccharide biosynthesis protein SpsF (cytidylyltransferase family)